MKPSTACGVEPIPLPDLGQGQIVDVPPIDQLQEDGVYVFPASLEQIRYWLLDQLDGTSTASNMAIAARLEGAVDDNLVERTIHSIVERHEALRTTFHLVEGRLSQIISEEALYSFSITDLRGLPETERASAAEAAVEEHSHARADLAVGPALFVRLIHLTDQLHFLALTMHHIVCDGWSNGILIRDFSDIYAALSQLREPNLPELPFQFADFTVWQQKWLESDAAEAALAYWRPHIRREMPAVDLPTDGVRLTQKSYPGHIESSLLSAQLGAKLKAYCRSHDATMHQVLLAAFEALICRYANQSEFLLGSTIANRTQPGMENVVGRFANPQVILADVTGDPTFSSLLGRVKEWSANSYAHQDLPFSRLMEEFQLDQAGAASPFLQVYFVYQKAFMQPQKTPGLKLVPRPSVSGGVNFDLLVSIVERGEGPRLQMEYNTVLFRKDRILRLIEMYIRVLDAVMDDDSLTVSSLPLSAESHPQDASPHDTNALSPSSSVSISEWIERLARTLGNSPALIVGDERLSWASLLERIDKFTAVFTASGVDAGKTVALRLETNFNDTAAALALLRIGAVVLPVPASATKLEWNRILALQQPELALASAFFAAEVPGVKAYEQLLDEQLQSDLARETGFPAPSAAAWLGLSRTAEGNLTTIPSTHEATLQRLLATAAALDMRSGDMVLVTPSQSATDAWIDLLLPLVSGSTILFPDTTMNPSIRSLLDLEQISFAFASPSDLLTALHDQWAGDRRLNFVVRGGRVTPGLLTRLANTPIRLWSLLSLPVASGPLAVAKATFRADPGIEPASQMEHVPLVGLNVAILDDNGQSIPAGVSGELAILSDSSSIRTGYLARLSSASGPGTALVGGPSSPGFEVIETVGRVVRLQGYRLRIGELEDLLWQLPSVADTVAVVLPVNSTNTLVVYFRTFDDSEEASRIVLNHFRSVAPGHLAGAELIRVNSIPRNAAGEVEFSLLPAPHSDKPGKTPSLEYLPPRDELEAKLVSIWEDVLQIRPIGIQTPFFKLGGYSLMIVRLFARINKVLGTSLPITTIFNAPTVEQLADIVRGRAIYSSLVPVQTGGTKPPFFMIYSYLLYQGLPKVLGEDYPFYGLRELDTDDEDLTLQQRALNYLEAMKTIQPHGPYYIGGWCAAGPLAVEIARQVVSSGEQVGFLVLFDSWRPGYADEVARNQIGTPQMSFRARFHRKYLFHGRRWQALNLSGKLRYINTVISNKFSSVWDKALLKNWKVAEWFCARFGLSLPHFMHNVSLTTLNSLKEYKQVDPYPGSLTLIRAKEAPYIPGAQDACGWDAITTQGVTVLWAPGDHESMFLDPHIQVVGALLRDGLTQAYAAQT